MYVLDCAVMSYICSLQTLMSVKIPMRVLVPQNVSIQRGHSSVYVTWDIQMKELNASVGF